MKPPCFFFVFAGSKIMINLRIFQPVGSQKKKTKKREPNLDLEDHDKTNPVFDRRLLYSPQNELMLCDVMWCNACNVCIPCKSMLWKMIHFLLKSSHFLGGRS